MLDYVGGQRPDMFLHMGDMAYSDGETFEFDLKFFAIYAEILRNTVVWPTMGNHEGHTSDSADESGPYYEAYVLPREGEAGGVASGTEAYYSFDYANVHFVILDSYESDREPGGTMLTWLSEDLAATDQEWLIAYWHHPAYTKGSHDSDYEGQLIDMRENALPILEAHGVDLVLAGHSHIYERSWFLHGAYDTPTTVEGYVADGGDGRARSDGTYHGTNDGAVYIVAGHGGTGVSQDGVHPAMYFIEAENGSCLLDVNGSSLTVFNIRYDGLVTDEFTIAKGELAIVAPSAIGPLLAGQQTQVSWSARGDTTHVHVDYSIDDGVNWYRAAEAVPVDESATWQVPSVVTDTLVLRVTDADAPATGDVLPYRTVNTGTFEVVPWRAVWEFDDSDVAPPATWKTTTGGWLTGPAQFGYGEDDESTWLTDVSDNIPSYYFRTTVALDAVVGAVELSVLYDDAIKVWVNGQEVLNRHIGDESHGAYSSGSGGDNAFETVSIPSVAFQTGDNVIAALVKQRNASSSDVSFDLRLVLGLTHTPTGESPDDPLIEGPDVPVDPDPEPGPEPGAEPGGSDMGPDIAEAAPDAGDSDVDTGNQTDVAGESDAGAEEQSDSAPGTTTVGDDGCGCASTQSGASSVLSIAFALLVIVRPRRRRHA